MIGYEQNYCFLIPFCFFSVPLHKIGCTRQFVSELTLRSFALSLHKIGCTRQFVSELTLRSFALSLQSKALLKAEIGSCKADTYI